ncbi:MAG TPA: family 20 glycosylhydrolase [Chitinophagaceae bacterium]|nr:family 20 glycosylhydrolase [Chitinophagaceae bacterium]
MAEEYLLHDHKDSSLYLSNQGFNDNVIDAALPSVYRFFEKVIDELQIMYAEANVPLTAIHVAGDEVPDGSWKKSPSIKMLQQKDTSIKSMTDVWKYYFSKIKFMLRAKNIAVYGWEELAIGTQTADGSRKVLYNPDFIKDSVQLDAWWSISGNEDIPYKLANTGYKVVLSNVDYFYFDLAYAKDFDEPGDAWVGYLDIEKTFSFIPFDYYKNATEDIRGNLLPPLYFANKEKLTEAGRKNIGGIQGALWAENLTTSQSMEYLLLPKLMVLAERAWVKSPDWAIEKDTFKAQQLYKYNWSVFVNQLGKRELPRLNFYHHGYNYRIPAVGALVINHKVNANVQLPGFIIRYTTNGSTPTIQSNIYKEPVEEKGVIKFKVFNNTGRSGAATAIRNK